MKLLAELNPDNVTTEEAAAFDRRTAARGVISDAEGLIALMNVRGLAFHKLPGGGIDEGETPEQAFIRECLEETGCQVKIVRELGRTEEYRSDIKRYQTSYGFLGEVIGKKGEPALEQSELEDGFLVEWVTPQRAEELLSKTKNHPKQALIDRDLIILRAALG